MTDLKTPYLDKVTVGYNYLNENDLLDSEGKETLKELQQIKAALKRLGELEAENKELKKRLLTAIDFVHSLAAGFPMGFWRRTRRAGEVLNKINP